MDFSSDALLTIVVLIVGLQTFWIHRMIQRGTEIIEYLRRILRNKMINYISKELILKRIMQEFVNDLQ